MFLVLVFLFDRGDVLLILMFGLIYIKLLEKEGWLNKVIVVGLWLLIEVLLVIVFLLEKEWFNVVVEYLFS